MNNGTIAFPPDAGNADEVSHDQHSVTTTGVSKADSCPKQQDPASEPAEDKTNQNAQDHGSVEPEADVDQSPCAETLVGMGQVEDANDDDPTTAVVRHAALLNHLAADHQGAGLLVIVGRDVDLETGEERPVPFDINDDLLPFGGAGHVQLQDADAAKDMIDVAVTLTADKHRHLYAPLAIMHVDLPAGRNGGEKDIVAVLGLGAHFSDDVDYDERLPLEPNYVLKAGDSVQAFYLLDKPATVFEAKRVAIALCEHAKSDPVSADLAHGWWVAGSYRWSGTGTELVRVVKPWDGKSSTALADLREALGVAEPEPEAASSGALGPTWNDAEVEELADDWPEPLAAAAFHGLAGEVVKTLYPHTEADEAALLLQFLTATGSIVGRDPYTRVEDDRHACNLFVALVGASGTSRKGASWGRIRDPLKRVDPTWASGRIMNGLASGEGLIHQVRDPVERRERVKEKDKGEKVRYETVIDDHGVEDKRLLVVEPELSRVFQAMTRDGNTLSSVLRQAWDGDTLCTMTKTSSQRATEPHVSLVGHITRHEVQQRLSRTDLGNGLANRFLFVCVKRSKYLPDGGALSEDDRHHLVEKVRSALEIARKIGRVQRDDEARALWSEMYRELSAGRPGILGAATNRAAAQVLRLSLIYAILDGSNMVRRQHLEAAREVWRYCEQSARYIFGDDSLCSPVAEKIQSALARAGQDGLSTTEIRRDVLNGHRSTSEIQQALNHLRDIGAVTSFQVKTNGRPATRWKALS